MGSTGQGLKRTPINRPENMLSLSGSKLFDTDYIPERILWKKCVYMSMGHCDSHYLVLRLRAHFDLLMKTSPSNRL